MNTFRHLFQFIADALLVHDIKSATFAISIGAWVVDTINKEVICYGDTKFD